MQRYTFYMLFKFLDQDTIEAIQRLRIGYITLNPGAQIKRGATLAGIDFFKYIDATYQCDDDDGTFVLRRSFFD